MKVEILPTTDKFLEQVYGKKPSKPRRKKWVFINKDLGTSKKSENDLWNFLGINNLKGGL